MTDFLIIASSPDGASEVGWCSAGLRRIWYDTSLEMLRLILAHPDENANSNEKDMAPLEHGAGTVHARMSGFYSSKQPNLTGSGNLTVRPELLRETL